MGVGLDMFLWRPALEEVLNVTINDVKQWDVPTLVQAHLICDKVEAKRDEAHNKAASAPHPRRRK